MYTRLATRPGLFAVSQRLAGLGARLVAPVSEWLKFPAFTGWGYSKDFPRPAVKPYRDRFQEIHHGDTENTEISKQTAEKLSELLYSAVQIDLVPRFIEELTALGGHVVETTTLELSTQLLSFLRGRNIDRVQAWDQIPGLDRAALTEAGISVQHEADESIKAGITGALAGIAETGTLVIHSGNGRPLTASLLPEVHIAILRASDIEENLPKSS